jgi:hypothetical protein
MIDSKISKKNTIEVYEITFNNTKDMDVEIISKDTMKYPNWEIENSSEKFEKKDSSKAEWTIIVPSKSNTTTNLSSSITNIL